MPKLSKIFQPFSLDLDSVDPPLHQHVFATERPALQAFGCWCREDPQRLALPFYADLCLVLIKPWLGVRSLPWLLLAVVSWFCDLASPQTCSFWDAWGKHYDKNTMISPYTSANRRWQNLEVFLTLPLSQLGEGNNSFERVFARDGESKRQGPEINAESWARGRIVCFVHEATHPPYTSYSQWPCVTFTHFSLPHAVNCHPDWTILTFKKLANKHAITGIMHLSKVWTNGRFISLSQRNLFS